LTCPDADAGAALDFVGDRFLVASVDPSKAAKS